MLHGSTEHGVINSDEGLEEGTVEQQLQTKLWELVTFQDTQAKKEGHFWLLCDCIT